MFVSILYSYNNLIIRCIKYIQLLLNENKFYWIFNFLQLIIFTVQLIIIILKIIDTVS